MWTAARGSAAALAPATACLVLALCAPAAHAQVWVCNGYEMEVHVSTADVEDSAYGLLACPADSWSFDLGVAQGQISHVSDGDSTTVNLQADIDYPGFGWSGYMYMLGYFWLEFEEATLVSMDYDVQHVQGSRGSISVVPHCDDPNTSVLARAGGVDFYFGPGGGACHARVEPRLSMSEGSYESNVTVSASSAPLPIVPSLAVEIIDRQGDGAGYELYRPAGVGVDASGNVFVTSTGVASAFQITPSGEISTIDELSSLDVFALAVDADGDVYITRGSSNVVTKITPGAGSTDIIDATGDGAGNWLDRPSDVTVDAAGNVYVVGQFSNNAFKITPGGTITEIIDASGDGTHAFIDPTAVAVDAAGNVYVAARVSGNAFAITPEGAITQILDASGDGGGNAIDGVFDLVAGPAGDVYVAGGASDNVFHVSPTGVITQLLDAGGNGSGHVCDLPQRMAVDPAGNLYVACYDSNNVLQVSPGGAVEELVNERGDGAEHPIRAPTGVAYGGGRLYVTGMWSHNAYRVHVTKQVPLPWGAGLVVAALILAAARGRLAGGAR